MTREFLVRLCFVGLLSATLLGCDQVQPQQVCATADTASNIQDLLNQTAVKNADKAQSDSLTAALKQLWTAGAIKLDLIALKSVDKDTKKIECSAQLQIKLSDAQRKAADPNGDAFVAAYAQHVDAYIFPTGQKPGDHLKDGQATFDMTFSRQPSADGKGYLYGFQGPEGTSEVLRFAAATQIVATKPTEVASAPAAAASSAPPATEASNVKSDDAAFEARLTPAYNQCMSQGDAAAGVTSAMADCSAAEIQAQDATLNATYQKVMAGLSPDAQGKLRNAERDWIKSRDSQCDAENQTGGTMDILNGAGCRMRATVSRTMQLEAMLTR